MDRSPMILGLVDGVGVVLGLILALVISHQSTGAVWHAALAGGNAELVSMFAAQWLATGGGRKQLSGAVACGVASWAGCVLPALPYLIGGGRAAMLAASVGLIVLSAGFVSWLRPEHGTRAVLQTFGVLAAVAGLCAVTA
jgi:VIT1/CCC1 family predicted Fe2+/Mn2+ transporter